jgi:hypothetical protein
MGVPREPLYCQVVVAAFSRHPDALDWAAQRLEPVYGPIARRSPDFDFHHTTYYEPTMGAGLVKRFLVFEPLAAADALADIKRHTIQLEGELAAAKKFPETRPLNLDPGLLQLGKFLLATTKDQSHRVYLRDGIFAEVTLRYHAGAFDVWPWTYADYREPAVRAFLGETRDALYQRVLAIRAGS